MNLPRAAHLLDQLAAIEQAHATDRPDDVRRILAAVDPYEVKAVAADLRAQQAQLVLMQRTAEVLGS